MLLPSSDVQGMQPASLPACGHACTAPPLTEDRSPVGVQAAALSLTPSDLSSQLAQGVVVTPGTLLRVAQWFRLEVRVTPADQVRAA